MARRTGRPRAAGTSPTGLGTRQDILHAAARLFCRVGYAGTSTHALAEVAGIRQATLYHHFSGKHEVLLELLLGTVQPSLDVARAVLAVSDDDAPADTSAAARLWTLVTADVALLLGGADNLGALYLLPELDDERLAAFSARRRELQDAYRALVGDARPTATDEVRGAPVHTDDEGHDDEAPRRDDATTAALVLGLVESVVLRRRHDPGSLDETTPAVVADAALAVVGLAPGARRRAAADGAHLLACL